MSSAAEMLRETQTTVNPQVVSKDSDPTDALPITVIERQPGWRFVDVADLWRYRELLFFLAWRDIKVRYKQTVLGAAWAVLQPLATMVVFTLFLGRTAGASTPDYPLFVFAGLLPWFFFANAVSSASQSIVGNERLVTKIYFPRLIIPTGAVGAAVLDFLISFGMLLLLMPFFGVWPGWQMLLVPAIGMGLVIAALAVGSLLAALTVAYRDFRYLVPFSIQLWMFATPCIYLDAKMMIGPAAQAWMPLNPAYGLILNFRAAVLGGPLDLYALGISSSVSVVLLLAACWYFRQVERSFADVI